MVGRANSWCFANIKALFMMLLCVCSMVCAQPSVRIKITNEEGIPLKQVATLQPFVLEVHLEGVQGNTQPKIRGIDQFSIEKQSMRMSVINGASTVVHRYSVVVDKPGHYRLGPVEVDEGNTPLRAPAVTVVVGKEAIEDVTAAAAVKRRERARKAFLQVSTDKSRVVVGEKFRCFVRFFFQEHDISLQQIQVPQFDSLIELSKSGPKHGKDVVDGINYDYLEWEWELLARQDGRKKIPVFNAEFMQQSDDDMFSGFHRMFRGFADHKRVHSNPVFVVVDPLPPFDREVKAVGPFSYLQASAEVPAAREGEGVVFVLELTGEGNTKELDTLPLTGIPQGLKAYPSKSYQVPHEPLKKRFEYILQAVTRGVWQIPAQTFDYFDVRTRAYRQLQSEPVKIAVLPSATEVKQTPRAPQEAGKEPETKQTEIQEEELSPLWQEYYAPHVSWKIPGWLFLTLMIIPLFIALYACSRALVADWVVRRIPAVGALQFWHKKHKQLLYARKRSDQMSLQTIFIEIFAQYSGLDRELITEEEMVKKLRRDGFSEIECVQWHEFWSAVSAALFSRHKEHESDCSLLFKQAQNWLEECERRLIKERP